MGSYGFIFGCKWFLQYVCLSDNIIQNAQLHLERFHSLLRVNRCFLMVQFLCWFCHDDEMLSELFSNFWFCPEKLPVMWYTANDIMLSWKIFLHYWPFCRRFTLYSAQLGCLLCYSPNKLLNKQSRSQWFEQSWHSCDVIALNQECKVACFIPIKEKFIERGVDWLVKLTHWPLEHPKLK